EEEEEITVVKFEHQPFFFAFDKYNLDAIAKQELDKLVSFLNTNSDMKIKIYGHTDSFGSIEYNKRLSKNRAVEAMNYLIGKGVSIDRISVVARHEEEPIAKTPDGATKENEIFRFNRRVEIEFLNADPLKFDIIRINPVPEKYRIN
ncbi:MAG: OmpA family protein, partial [Bacteroidales bacterium]|nr:OmpA family protein [Bacteroidales bacterium]